MTGLIKLQSVGNYYHAQIGKFYPILKNGSIDLEMGVKLEEVSDEFFASLSNSDWKIITKSDYYTYKNNK